ncbi:MAG: hypothetical protein AB8B83_09225 [Bdellovibrionales bacterium]
MTTDNRSVKKIKTCAFAICLVTAVSTGSSFAFSIHNDLLDSQPPRIEGVVYQHSHSQHKTKHSSSTVTDSCLPLLKSFQKTPSKSVIDRNQRTAGKVAALGLILGARYALTPPVGTPANKVDTSETIEKALGVTHQRKMPLANDRSALAISAYRACQKRQALAEISEIR